MVANTLPSTALSLALKTNRLQYILYISVTLTCLGSPYDLRGSWQENLQLDF